jgi:hypothetical protein
MSSQGPAFEEEEARSEPRSINGLQINGPDPSADRPEPPDTSGARR